MNKDWQELVDRAWAQVEQSRRSRGYKPTPVSPVVSKAIREMPNLFLRAIGDETGG